MEKSTKRDPDYGGMEIDQGGAMKPRGEMSLTPMQKAWVGLMTVIAIVALILGIVACTKTYTNDDYALKTEVVSAAAIKSDSTVMKNINDITAMQADITALEQGKASKTDVSSALSKQGGVYIQTTDHASLQDGFWDPVRCGYDDAAMAVGVSQTFQPGLGDLPTMKSRISNAGKTQVDGLVVSLWSRDLLPSIKVAINNNVPVISINSGIDDYEEAGIQVHISQDEGVAGKMIAATMIKDLDNKDNIPADFKWKALCVNHEPTNSGTTKRCDEFQKEMQKEGHSTTIYNIPSNFDFTSDAKKEEYQNKIKEYVDADVNAILTLNNNIAVYTYEKVEAMNKKNQVDISTFDIDPAVTTALTEGHIDFAVDQQPYLQGFLPIALLNLKARYELMLNKGALLTGPYIVTGSNADMYATRDYKNPSTALKEPKDIRIAVVTHGQIHAGFWQVVQNGVKSAMRDFGISVEYRHPTEQTDETDDTVITVMTSLVNEYVTEAISGDKIDGLVISIPSCGDSGGAGALWKQKILEALQNNIPVISINSGDTCWQDFGSELASEQITAHIGADETLAGATVGEWLGNQVEFENKKVLCISHERSNTALKLRCDGIETALKAAWGSTYSGYTYFFLTKTTEADKQQEIKDKVAELGMNSGDVMITHGPMTAGTAMSVSNQIGTDGPRVGTYDLSFGILESMAEGGKGLFCVDQQQFMQGYLPVMFHYLNARWGNKLPQQFVKTGPAMISDHTMATHLLRLVEDKIR